MTVLRAMIRPVDRLTPPNQNVIQYFISCLETGTPPEGPLSPTICRIGQQIVDSAILSARERRTVPVAGLTYVILS